MASHPAVQQALAAANRSLQVQDMAGAERALASLSILGLAGDPDVLNMLGAIRLSQGRFADALSLLSQGRAAAPREPMLACNLGRALAGLGRFTEAGEAFSAAIKLRPDFVDARYELAQLLHGTRNFEAAEKEIRQILRIMPGHLHAKMALGAVLADGGRPLEAEVPLRRGLEESPDPRLKAQFHLHLSLALRRQRKDEEALLACDNAQKLDPAVPGLALHRAEALQNLRRHDEALAVLRDHLTRNPGDPGTHHFYNDLLHRLGRKDEFLKSYDLAPQSRSLLLGKAFFLTQENRDAEAHAIYSAMLARDPGDPIAGIGVANALSMLKRHDEAGAAYDGLLARHGGSVDLYRRAAEPALLLGDPGKAAWLCEQALAQSPREGSCLALLSIASRMLEDGRDETLNGYDTLVRSFDLEPPEGFSDMASFNAELDRTLDRLHHGTGEYLGQSLRGGTQTPDNLFGAGHVLIKKLRARIDQAVERYIAELADDPEHPFLSRRARNFRYAGSWSSRLRDSGFHVNHLHPMGWISSCYYVAVPDAAKDESTRQGWIKFGEPSFDVVLKNPVRRAIQPVPGRLVLFPSYMWHGTIPFHDRADRTTI
ncbi:MAG: tetratricopeptide repeat protein, partial [Rhizomicrobium sp.]